MTLVLSSPGISRLRLCGGAMVVVLVHLFLLKQATKSDWFAPASKSKNAVSISLLSNDPASVKGLPKADVRPQDSNKSTEKSAQKTNVRALTSTALSTTDSSTAQADAQLSLDFQWADIQGAELTLGTLNLSLKVEEGKYESRALWIGDKVRRETSSSGIADATFRPTYFSDSSIEPLDLGKAGEIQDLLSAVWNLRYLTATRTLQSGSVSEQIWDAPFQMGDHVSMVHWKIESLDDLIVPAGRFRAVKVLGTTDEDSVARWSIWYAVDFAFTPVRVEQRDSKGRIQDLKITTPLEKNISSR